MPRLLCILFCLFVSFSIKAQSGWNWPDEKTEPGKHERAKEMWIYADDRIKGVMANANLSEAAPAIQWLLKNTPKLNVALYINASSLYESLVNQETNAAKKRKLQDSALAIYDLRIKHFGNEAEVLNRKGLKAWYYLHGYPSEIDQLFTLYKKIVELNANKTYALNVYAYMDLLCKQVEKGNVKDENALTIYNQLSGIIKANISGPEAGTWTTIKEKVDLKMLNCINLPCDYVKEKYQSDFDNSPTLEEAKLIFGLLLKGECIKDPLFVATAKYIYDKDPTEGLATTIAKSCRLKQDDACALEYYEKAASVSENAGNKADIYYQMAHIYKKQDKKPQARDFALKAVNTDPSKKVAYELIGQLYYESFDECASENDLQSKSIFLAAYEMFEKAGAKDKMEKVTKGFPSAKTIFEYGRKEGEKMNTGCWINETVTIRKRPQ